MLLALDMGNTNIVLGCIDDNNNIYGQARIKTDKFKTDAEYAVILKNILDIYNINISDISGAAVSSVVPPLNETLKRAVKTVTGLDAAFMTVKSADDLKIAVDNPKQLGNDLIVAAAAALSIAEPPLIIIDMGTATTFSVIDADGVFCGTSIIPGIEISIEALSTGTSQLPHIELEAPGSVIGKNTVDSMKSGIIFGSAAMLDGMIERISYAMGTTPCVIATGGLARLVVPYCRRSIIYDENLLLKGLKLLYDKNN